MSLMGEQFGGHNFGRAEMNTTSFICGCLEKELFNTVIFGQSSKFPYFQYSRGILFFCYRRSCRNKNFQAEKETYHTDLFPGPGICCMVCCYSLLSHVLFFATPDLLVLHYILEFAETHVHLVSDAIQPSYPLSFPSPPAINLSQHQSLF